MTSLEIEQVLRWPAEQAMGDQNRAGSTYQLDARGSADSGGVVGVASVG